MEDILDIHNTEEFEEFEDGEQGNSNLKKKSRKRKVTHASGFSDEAEAGGSAQRGKRGRYDNRAPGGEGSRPGSQRKAETWVLFVDNVHQEAQKEDIQTKFSQFGVLKNVRLNQDQRCGFAKGFALVEFETYEQAVSARAALDGADLLGKAISVDWCFVKGLAKRHKNKL